MNNTHHCSPRLLTSLALAIGLASPVLADGLVTFDDGAAGWIGPTGGGGFTVVEADGGNPGAHLHTVFNNFGITFTNSSNPDFVMDYSQVGSATFSIDVHVVDISFFGAPAPRPWVLELRDYDNPPGSYPYVSVWYEFDWIGAGEWTTWSVTIEDTSMTDLPDGWGGYGDETPLGEPLLPADRTFTDVLAGVDEVAFTTFEPGWLFGTTHFDMRLDNISVTTVPTGTTCATDLDGDGETGFSDLLEILVAWGPCKGEGCAADIDSSGVVDFADVLATITAWGPCF